MKKSSYSKWSALSGGIFLLSLPVMAVLHGCGGGGSSNPAATATPVPTLTPIPAKTKFVLEGNGISTLENGTVNFTRNQTSTLDQLEGSISVKSNSPSVTRSLKISISATGSLKAGQTFRVGTLSNATTSLLYRESIGIAYSSWVNADSGQVTIVALSETALELRVKDVKMDRRASDGPLGPGSSFTLNGTLVVPNPP